MRGWIFRQSERRIATLDDSLTPLEIADRLARNPSKALPFAIADLLAKAPPVSYRREQLAAGARLFTAGRGAPGLIIGFCGARHRLLVSSSHFLQMMDETLVDVLILQDRARHHYLYGVEGFSGSLHDTVRALASLIAARGYSRVYTYGTSMGGLPALRAGLLLGADRAISVGGRLINHAERLLEGEEVGGFDPICRCCRPQTETETVLVYGEDKLEDALDAHKVSRVLPHARRMAIPTPEHNIAKYLDGQGLLAAYYSHVFGFPDAAGVDFDAALTELRSEPAIAGSALA